MLAYLRRQAPAAARIAASVPPGVRVYAVGDVHGRLDCLMLMEAMIADDIAARPIANPVVIHLGDYIDRGPDSHGVIETLSMAATPARHHLLGNHERFLLDALDNPARLEGWSAVGGLAALRSYGVDPGPLLRGRDPGPVADALREAMPPHHLAFLRRLDLMLVVGDYCFVHAGLRPGVALERQEADDVIWLRDEFLNHRGSFGHVVVHGHTAVPEAEIHPNRINLDSGAYASGRLSAAVLEGATVRIMVAQPASR